jgi:hypothetical protein
MSDETNLGSPAKHLMPGSRPVWSRTRAGIAVIGFALIAAFYVLREHWGHAFGAVPRRCVGSVGPDCHGK